MYRDSAWDEMKRSLGRGARGMAASQRRKHLLLIDRMHPRPTNNEIAEFFGVSSSAIGKDRRILKENRGHGLVAIEESLRGEEEVVKGTDKSVQGAMSRLVGRMPEEMEGDEMARQAWDGWYLSRETAETARRNGDLGSLNAALNSMFRWTELLERRYEKLRAPVEEEEEEEDEEGFEVESDYGG